MRNNTYVQYGCGWSAPAGWRNFDASPTLRFERLPVVGHMYTRNKRRFPRNVEYGDIVKGLPVALNSCSAVYCSHILEHLALNDFRMALRNTMVILHPGCVFRFVLPDLEFLIKEYTQNQSDAAAMKFMQDTSLGHRERAKGVRGFVVNWLGNHNHLWMWDYKSMQFELDKAGFVGIRPAAFGDSSDSAFEAVEERARWENALGVECKKAD